MREKQIAIKIQSTFAIGRAASFQDRLGSAKDGFIKIAPGTTVEMLLRRMPSIGSPDQWDDMMLTVFVNGTLRGYDHVLENNDVIDLHIPVSGG